MSRVGVIGAGIAGLAASWLLSRRHDVLLFEREPRLGGHTHTHDLDTPDGRLRLDTGFLVHNDRTYPLLIRLLAEVGVDRVDSDMSFAVSDPRTGFEYSTRSLATMFADRRTLVDLGHHRMLLEILRFGRRARALLDAGDADALTLGAFLDRERFSARFIDRYLFPLAAAIWSAAPDSLRGFPAATLIRFFHQHGMLTALDHPTWKMVRGGSATYIPKLIAPPRIQVHLGASPTDVARTAEGVRVAFADRPPVDVDHLVFACHGDQVLPLLSTPTPVEREVLGAFRTTANDTWLHTDASFLPRRAAARASWNYELGTPGHRATVTYHLNRLQRLDVRSDYCVTLNPARPVDPARVLARMDYRHPLYTREAVAAQARWGDISGTHRIHYCGAYWYYGFHEDGLRSAVRVAAALGVTW